MEAQLKLPEENERDAGRLIMPIMLERNLELGNPWRHGVTVLSNLSSAR